MSCWFRVLVLFAALPRKIWNKLLNILVSAPIGHRIVVDWTDARILNAARIRLQGRFQAGRGLWLQAIGDHSCIEIGDGARLSDLVHIGAVGHLRIGRNVLIGSKVLIIDHSHGRGFRIAPHELLIPPGERELASCGNITIGDNVWLADNVIVLAGVTIGNNCVVGAHSLVRSDLPPNSVCVGNPARVVSTYNTFAASGPVASQPMRIAAIYTTYHPDYGFRQRIRHVVEHCALTIVVDNTPGGHTFAPGQTDGLVVLQDGRNKGLGAALNAGLAEAQKHGCDAVVLFDQDSSPRPDFIVALFEGLASAGSRAILGPLLVDDAQVLGVAPVANAAPQIDDVTCIATSGMCFRLDGLSPTDRFTEDFFLDFVDFDWCWRLRKQGWRICRLRSLLMPHRLGLAQRQFLGLTYHVPAPFRHYFQFRDALKLSTRSYVPLYSRLRLSVILVPKLLIYPFLLDHGLERLRWMLRGIRDAICSVPGVGAAASKLQGTIIRNS